MEMLERIKNIVATIYILFLIIMFPDCFFGFDNVKDDYMV